MKKLVSTLFLISFISVQGILWAEHPAIETIKESDKTVLYVCSGKDNCHCGTISLQEGKCPCGMELERRISQSSAKDLKPLMEAIASDPHLLGHMTDIIAESDEARERLIQSIMNDPDMVELLKKKLSLNKDKKETTTKVESTPKVTKPKIQKPVYTCVMHPEVISDKPGKCPKCGMFLTEKK